MPFKRKVPPEEVVEEDEAPEKFVETLLGTRTATQEEWRLFLSHPRFFTVELTRGSVWLHNTSDWYTSSPSPVTRYLVKWRGLSHMHVSWELRDDLLDTTITGGPHYGTAAHVTPARCLARFDRMAALGLSVYPHADLDTLPRALHPAAHDPERLPPQYLQVDRVLDFIDGDERAEHIPCQRRAGLHGTNCSLTVKWRGLQYSMSTFEEVSDLQVA